MYKLAEYTFLFIFMHKLILVHYKIYFILFSHDNAMES